MPKQTRQAPNVSPFDILAKRREAADTQTSGQPRHPDGQPERTDFQGPVPGRGGKRSDPGFQKFTVYISKPTHRSAKAIANLQGRELSEVVEELLKAYVKEQQANALKNL